MPYNAVTKDGIELNNIPDHLDQSSPELIQLVEDERRKRRQTEAQNTGITPEQKAEALAGVAGEMGSGERALVNFGAGVDQLWSGIKQITPGLTGPSDDDIRQKRVLNKALAKATETGAGADWMPSGGSAVQFAGEVLPTMLIPGGAVAGGARAAAQSGGLQLARRMLMGTPTRAGATMGAGTAALMPVTSGESRTGNMAMGLAGGALAPTALKAYRAARPFATKAGRANRRDAKAGGELIERLGEPDARHAADMIEGYTPTGAAAQIPSTTAERVRLAEGANASEASAKLGGIELGSRGALADEFAQLQRNKAAGTYRATQDALVDRDSVDALGGIRDAATAPMRGAAMESASRWSEVARPLGKHVEDLAKRSIAGSPERSLARHALAVLAENPNPDQLYLYHKLLSGKLSGPYQIGDEVSSMVKGANRETKALMKAIEDRLDEAGKSKALGDTPFTDYLGTYSGASRPVDSARAQADIFEAIAPVGGRLVGDHPQITPHTLNRVVDKFSHNDFGDKLEPAARGRVDDLIETLRRMEEPVATVKLGGTGGGGSQTAMQQALVSRAGSLLEGASGVPLLGEAARMAMRSANETLRRDIAGLMINPERAANAIRLKLMQNQPLSESETMIMAALGSMAGAAQNE